MTQIIPRPYQEEVREIVRNLPDGSRVIIHMATGLGKTATMSMFDRKGRMLILSHRDELVRQPEKYFEGVSFGIEKAEEHANGEDIISASVQTLCKDKRLHSYEKDAFDIIVVDEAHHAAASSYRKILGYFTPRLLIGLTATPQRSDNAKLDDVFDEIVYSRDLMWGIRNGYLSNVKSLAVRTDISLDHVSMTAGDYNQKELSEAIDQDEMYDTVVETYKKYVYGTDRHVIIYCLSVKGCTEIEKHLLKAMPDENGKTAIITGSTPQEERNSYLDAYLHGDVRCLINCMVLTEGTDLPITDTIIIARPTAKETLYTQIIGRGTRLHEGKDHCLVLDILPESTHKLCCAATLAGIDLRSLSKKERDKLLNEEQDLAKIIEQKEEEERRQRQLAEALTLRVQEYDFINGLIIEKTKELKESKDLSHLASVITGDQDEMLATAAEEDGITDFHGLHYHLGRTDETRYQFQGEEKDYLFTLSKPDMLGKSMAEGYVNGVKYRTEKPQPVNDLLHTIRQIFQQNCMSLYHWNQDTIDSWKQSKATPKQMGYVRALLRGKGTYAYQNKPLSKYEANMIIDHILQLNKLEEEAKKMKKNLKAVAEDPKTDTHRQFEELMGKYNKEGLSEEVKNRIESKRELQVLVSNEWISINPPSEKQIRFIQSLIQTATSRHIQFDLDLLEQIPHIEGQTDISRLITILKSVNQLPDYFLYGYTLCVKLKPIWDSITNKEVQENELFRIPYLYEN